jgi:REP element-mobilizing transposase RayT
MDNITDIYGTLPTPNVKRKFLPHIDMIEHYQFVTFRTFDSIDEFVKKIRNSNTINKLKEYNIDKYIDNSKKGYYLNGEVLEYLKSFLKSKDKDIYDLVSFVIMPNHIHILFKQNIALSKIMQILKGSTSFKINKMLKRSGAFWEQNYYDKVIRDEKHFNLVYDYIKNNPIKVGLKDYENRFYTIYE